MKWELDLLTYNLPLGPGCVRKREIMREYDRVKLNEVASRTTCRNRNEPAEILFLWKSSEHRWHFEMHQISFWEQPRDSFFCLQLSIQSHKPEIVCLTKVCNSSSNKKGILKLISRLIWDLNCKCGNWAEIIFF